MCISKANLYSASKLKPAGKELKCVLREGSYPVILQFYVLKPCVVLHNCKTRNQIVRFIILRGSRGVHFWKACHDSDDSASPHTQEYTWWQMSTCPAGHWWARSRWVLGIQQLCEHPSRPTFVLLCTVLANCSSNWETRWILLVNICNLSLR